MWVGSVKENCPYAYVYKKIFNGNAWYRKWTFFTTIMYLAQNKLFLNTRLHCINICWIGKFFIWQSKNIHPVIRWNIICKIIVKSALFWHLVYHTYLSYPTYLSVPFFRTFKSGWLGWVCIFIEGHSCLLARRQNCRAVGRYENPGRWAVIW